jgi:hypothetical protein
VRSLVPADVSAPITKALDVASEGESSVASLSNDGVMS